MYGFITAGFNPVDSSANCGWSKVRLRHNFGIIVKKIKLKLKIKRDIFFELFQWLTVTSLNSTVLFLTREASLQNSKQNKKSLSWNGRCYGNHSFYDKVHLYFKTEKVGPLDSANNPLELSLCLHFWSERTKVWWNVEKIMISSLKSNM